jgi:ubiquinone/menaquinone biosynthesis C-methylase UbiE
MPLDVDRDGFYPKEYYDKRIAYFDKPSRFYLDRLNFLSAFCEFRGNESVLNIGCGIGTTEIEFAGQYGTMTGVDHNFLPLQLADQVFKARLSGRPGKNSALFVAAKAQQLPFRDNSFDVVLCADFDRVLKHKGRLLIYAPSAEHVFEYAKAIRRRFSKKNNPSHDLVNRISYLKKSLHDNRFAVIDCLTKPSHLFFVKQVEILLCRFKKIGTHFGRRIWISAEAVKSDENR